MLSNAVSSYYSNINNINYDNTFLTTYKLHSDDDDRNLCYQLQLLQALNISNCLLYTSPSPRDRQKSRMPSSA